MAPRGVSSIPKRRRNKIMLRRMEKEECGKNNAASTPMKWDTTRLADILVCSSEIKGVGGLDLNRIEVSCDLCTRLFVVHLCCLDRLLRRGSRCSCRSSRRDSANVTSLFRATIEAAAAANRCLRDRRATPSLRFYFYRSYESRSSVVIICGDL
jgi:hypothetical protein